MILIEHDILPEKIHLDKLDGVKISFLQIGVGDVCFFLTMRCFNDAMFSNS